MEFSWVYFLSFVIGVYLIIGGIIASIVLKQKVKPTRYLKNQIVRKVKLKEVAILVLLSPILIIYNFLFG